MRALLLLLFFSSCLAHAFEITASSAAPAKAGRGGAVRLTCAVDGYFEFCTWRKGEGVDQRRCDFEWKRAHDSVQNVGCTAELKARMGYAGDYEKHECSVVLSEVEAGDGGEWTCAVQKYVLGFVGGAKREATVTFTVEEQNVAAAAGTTGSSPLSPTSFSDAEQPESTTMASAGAESSAPPSPSSSSTSTSSATPLSSPSPTSSNETTTSTSLDLMISNSEATLASSTTEEEANFTAASKYASPETTTTTWVTETNSTGVVTPAPVTTLEASDAAPAAPTARPPLPVSTSYAGSEDSFDFSEMTAWFRRGDVNTWIVVVCGAVIALLSVTVVALFAKSRHGRDKYALDYGFAAIREDKDVEMLNDDDGRDDNRTSTSTQILELGLMDEIDLNEPEDAPAAADTEQSRSGAAAPPNPFFAGSWSTAKQFSTFDDDVIGP